MVIPELVLPPVDDRWRVLATTVASGTLGTMVFVKLELELELELEPLGVLVAGAGIEVGAGAVWLGGIPVA